MTTFSGRKFGQLLAATLMLLGIAACNNDGGGETPTTSVPTDTSGGTITFKCVQQGGTWTTVVEAQGAGQAPVISWQTTEFGPSWTPNQRCQTVSQKLSKAVSDSGGDWDSLDLNTGKVREYTVVCVVKSGERGCTEDNMVVTLNSRNAQNPSSVLGKISDLDPTNPPAPIAE